MRPERGAWTWVEDGMATAHTVRKNWTGSLTQQWYANASGSSRAAQKVGPAPGDDMHDGVEGN